MYFKQCPFCDEVFDIGPADHQLMEVHIAEKHRDEKNNWKAQQWRGQIRLRTTG